MFEWNGSMLHAKTAVADGRWARVGSSNLNLASWIGNCELDIAVENEGFAGMLEQQYELDLENATEIVLATRSRGSPREATRRTVADVATAAGVPAAPRPERCDFANTIGAAITNRRTLGPGRDRPRSVPAPSTSTVGGLLVLIWPRLIAWPLGLLAIWFAIVMFRRFWNSGQGCGSRILRERECPEQHERGSGQP